MSYCWNKYSPSYIIDVIKLSCAFQNDTMYDSIYLSSCSENLLISQVK